MEKDFFKDRKVLVMGLGQFGGGLDSAVFACKAGAQVTVTDLAKADNLADPLKQLKGFDVQLHLGAHIEQDFSTADIIIVNPAVAPENKFLQVARQADKLITSQIEIFFQLCPATIVGITGANGKSTTTALTAHLLEAGLSNNAPERKVRLGGNIGNKPLLSEIDEISPDDVQVLELSSFQLEQLSTTARAPHVSVITNLTPNHLDRHGTFEAYCLAKENIFKYQTLNENQPAVSIFNAEDPITAEWFRKYSQQAGRSCFAFNADDVRESLIAAFTLPGRANLSNLAAARTVAAQFGIGNDMIEKALGDFQSLRHRLELIAHLKGVSWYDDSIATTPPSAIAALHAFESPKIIIAGGYDKKLPFDELGRQIARTAKAAILIGTTASKIAQAIETSSNRGGNVRVTFASSMPDAVQQADALAEDGDVVLLSPACASYDMFDNYRQRGDIFAQCVRQLKE
jgi:UDP-N-acetylmuramoylalanine--D-glutamate ligase